MSHDICAVVVLSLVACCLGLTGCGETPEEKKDPIFVITEDMSGQQDESDDMVADMMSDTSTDQSTLPPGCDSVGFMPETVTASRSATSLSLIGSTEAQSNVLNFFLSENDLQNGSYTFKDENFKSCTVCLAYQEGCDEDGCEATYIATQGNAAVSTTETNMSLALDVVRMTQVKLDGELNSTKVPNGKTHCLIDPITLSGSLTVDLCSNAPELAYADVSCGPAPLTVKFVAPDGGLDRVDSISWDFGDGETARGSREVEHVFSAGEWRVEVKIQGIVSETSVTLTVPQLISVY